jgi:hypothetical protein
VGPAAAGGKGPDPRAAHAAEARVVTMEFRRVRSAEALRRSKRMTQHSLSRRTQPGGRRESPCVSPPRQTIGTFACLRSNPIPHRNDGFSHR